MKKIISLLLMAITAFSVCIFGSCAKGRSTVLAEPKQNSFKNDYFALKDADDFMNGLAIFSAEFSETYAKTTSSNANFSISPVSVFMALCLAEKCADGQTRTEILNALNITQSDLDEYAGKLYRSLNVEYTTSGPFNTEKTVALSRFTNSIWLDDGVKFKQPVLNELAEKLYCYSYKTPFSSDTSNANKAVREFVKQNTKGLIDQDFKLSRETLFALINTLYLKEIWNELGKDLIETQPKVFVNSDSTEIQTPFLTGEYVAGAPYRNENYSSFYTRTSHGYKLCFILPENGATIEQAFNAENIAQVIKGDIFKSQESKYEYSTRCLFPSFTADSNKDIKDVLSSMGIKSLFTGCNMKNLTDDAVYCSSVIHSSKLKVDKTGIEGAAVTVIVGDKASQPLVKLDYVIDRAFGFVLSSSENVPLFSGIVNKI